jgi:hypothetical protein
MLQFTHKLNRKLFEQERKPTGEFSVLRCACNRRNITSTIAQMFDVIFSNASKEKNIKILNSFVVSLLTFSSLIGQSVLQQYLP